MTNKQKQGNGYINILSAVLIIAALGGIMLFRSGNKTADKTNDAFLEINQKEYDFGNIAIKDGNVNHIFEIKNVGGKEAKITNIWTSCHCTTANVTINDKEGQEYGMNSETSFANEKIKPGETAYLKVIFDPAFHGPMGTGYATRVIYLKTNDSVNKKIELKINANVI